MPDFNLEGFSLGIGFSDVIDIAIMSFVIYHLIGYIRNTRAKQLFKGLFIVLAAYLVSDIASLYATNWVLTKLLDVGIIALVVIFQPEIRRTLEMLGRRNFRMGKLDVEGNAEIIANAMSYFSSKKEGAIIVIEKEIALTDIAETGTIIDAQISTQLLENIFYKGAPLHDGAVIIREDRILAAGGVLPLTSNANLSSDLGTRHRAGIGISEVSDAMVFIASEETGIISMVSDGKLSRFLDRDTVVKKLSNYYFTRADSKQNIFSAIFEPKNKE